MSDLQTTNYLEDVYEKYWEGYETYCEQSGIHPSTSDFLIYLDENNLIPEYDDE